MLESLLDLDTRLLLAINGASSPFGDSFMWDYTQIVVWIPMLLTVVYVIAKNNKLRDSLLLVVCLALTFVLADQISSSFFKPTFQRLRPTHDPALAEFVRVVNDYRGGRFGFVSGHAANSFAALTFCALVIRSWKFTVPLTLWALVNCWSRMYLGVHYPGDIICGALVGVFSGIVTYCLFLLGEKYLFKQSYKVAYKSVSLINAVFLASVAVLLVLATIEVYL